jgi:hypothetical protein
MARYLYTAESSYQDLHGLSVGSGIRMSEFALRPELKTLTQGVMLELQLPDGRSHQTHLVNWGISTFKEADGSLLVENDPFVRFILPTDLTPGDVPPGTELWWLEDQPGLSDEEVMYMLERFQNDSL